MPGPSNLPYQGRSAVLVTLHGKIQQVRPALLRAGLDVTAVEADTDAFGTFTGEVPRPHAQLETAVAKARLAHELTGCSLGLASEGSFSPHPDAPWSTVDTELVVLVEFDRGRVVVGRHSTLDTIAATATVTVDDLGGRDAVLRPFFLDTCAVTARPSRPRGPLAPAQVRKGLRTVEQVAAAVAELAPTSVDGHVRLDTDLRAHVHPGRQVAIAAAAADLAERLRRRCPLCGEPGWGRTEPVRGLRCRWCLLPTDEIRGWVQRCPSCGGEAEDLADSPAHADPARCAHCNP